MMAAPFDLSRLAVTGEAVGVMSDLMQAAYQSASLFDSGAAQLSIAETGATGWLSYQCRDGASTAAGEPSQTIRERVEAAREIQRARFRKGSIRSNGEMTTRYLRKHCELDQTSRGLLERALGDLGLSARAYDRILKVARTIADLAGQDSIASPHVAEAIQYRALDRAYFRT